MEFRILGPLEVADDRRDLTPPRPKQRAFLALLLLRAGELVTPEQAAEAMWGHDPPPAARNAIQGHVASLRKLLGRDRIRTRAGSYQLVLEEGELDLHRFERLVGDAGGRPPQERVELLGAALGLFRGEPLEDFRYDDFASAEAARIAELHLLAVEERFEAELELGRHETLVPQLEALVRETPLRERVWGQLVLALYRSGRQADALAAQRRARAALDELGLEPGPELQQLERRVLQQDPELDAVPIDSRVRLPSPPTPFLGRARELEAIGALLRQGSRVVTLVGPGGAGKTRLALEVARRNAPLYSGRTVFVALAPLTDPELVLDAIARALEVRDGGSAVEEAVAARVGNQPTLVLLDNVEHLAAAVPTLGRLVAAAAGLTLLATSREPLRLYGEQLFRVEALDPDSAAELFVARAAAIGAAPGDAETVDEICRRLDRLPLAIELAAARVDTLEPAALLEGLAEPLDLLDRGAVDLHPRQHTLRRTLAWSHERLEPEEQRLFARLAVFAGGWTVDAAAAICSDDGLEVVAGLSSLLDKSLVQADVDVPVPRQSMLETIREYAREQLLSRGEEEEIGRRHAAHYLELAEASEERLRGNPADWLERLELEHPNFLRALDAAPTEMRVRLAGALWRFWYLRGHLAEGRRRLERALGDAAPGAPRIKALLGAAVMSANTGDPEAAQRHAAEARSLAAATGDAWSEAYARFMLANVAADADEARRDYGLAIRSFRALGDAHSALLASRHLALLLGGLGDSSAAVTLHLENLAAARELGNGRLEASSLGALAELDLRDGQQARAASRLRESLAIHRELGDVLDTSLDLCRFAAAIRDEDAERAAMLVGAFEGLGDAAAGRRGWVAELNAETLGDSRELLGADEVAAAVARGRELSLDEAVELALGR